MMAPTGKKKTVKLEVYTIFIIKEMVHYEYREVVILSRQNIWCRDQSIINYCWHHLKILYSPFRLLVTFKQNIRYGEMFSQVNPLFVHFI